MKYITTQKAVKENYYTIQVNYCALQHLLQYEQPEAYTCGTYGWNADVYGFDSVAIVTGYRPFGHKVKWETVCQFENMAKQIIRDLHTYEERKEALRKLISEFIEMA